MDIVTLIVGAFVFVAIVVGIVALPFGAFYVLFSILQGLDRVARHRQILRERKYDGDAKDRFRDHFVRTGVSARVVRETYHVLSRQLLSVKEIAVYPQDRLDSVFGDANLEDIIRDIAHRLNMRVTPGTLYLDATSTVDTLVKLMNTLYRELSDEQEDRLLLRAATAPANAEHALLKPANATGQNDADRLLRVIETERTNP